MLENFYQIKKDDSGATFAFQKKDEPLSIFFIRISRLGKLSEQDFRKMYSGLKKRKKNETQGIRDIHFKDLNYDKGNLVLSYIFTGIDIIDNEPAQSYNFYKGYEAGLIYIQFCDDSDKFFERLPMAKQVTQSLKLKDDYVYAKKSLFKRVCNVMSLILSIVIGGLIIIPIFGGILINIVQIIRKGNMGMQGIKGQISRLFTVVAYILYLICGVTTFLIMIGFLYKWWGIMGAVLGIVFAPFEIFFIFLFWIVEGSFPFNYLFILFLGHIGALLLFGISMKIKGDY